MKIKKFISSSKSTKLSPGKMGTNGEMSIYIENELLQEIQGFGACFSEISLKTANSLSSNELKQEIFSKFFSKENLNLNHARIPIGASDFATSWYSLDEEFNDYDLKHFSIDRDKHNLIPLIKDTIKYRDSPIIFMASPWSPPTWLKFPQAYNHGTLKNDEKTYNTYANYLIKFIKAYENEGIHISQINVQNEPVSDQKFPSCKWSADEFLNFINNYLYPSFSKEMIDTEIWLGTINGPENWMDTKEWHIGNYTQYAGKLLQDKKFQSAISGIAYQWGGKFAIAQTHEDYPTLRLIQSESECGNGDNSFESLEYIFSLIKYYFNNGIESYYYWNMILDETAKSTWGWKQNSLITINSKTEEVIYNPEYYLMYHFSHFIKKGARLTKIHGTMASNTLCFTNPEGSKILIILNPYDNNIDMSINDSNYVMLPAHSISTIVLE